MDTFGIALTFVLQREGGFVNNPLDPGGATNKGITQNTYNAWRRKQGLPVRDVRDIEDSEVRAIYESDYWRASGANKLNWPLALLHFDSSVNHGVGNANAMLKKSGGSITEYLKVREQFYRSIVARTPSQSVFLNGWLNRLKAIKMVLGISLVVFVFLTVAGFVAFGKGVQT